MRRTVAIPKNELRRFNVIMGFPGGSDSKVSAFNVGDPGSIPGLGRSAGEGNGNPLQYCCLEKFHGLRSLVGYSPWGCKESDTSEQLHVGTYVRYKNQYNNSVH